MARPEKAIDPDDRSPHAEFARELRRLRASAGSPPYRQLALQTHFGLTTLSQAASVGTRPPTPEVTRALVRALGGDWEGEWALRYRTAFGGRSGTAGPVGPVLDAVRFPDSGRPAAGPLAGAPGVEVPLAVPTAPGRPEGAATLVLTPAGPPEPPGMVASPVIAPPAVVASTGMMGLQEPPEPIMTTAGRREVVKRRRAARWSAAGSPGAAPTSWLAGMLRPLLVGVLTVLTATVCFGAGSWRFGWFVTASAEGFSRIRTDSDDRAAMRTCADRSCTVRAAWASGTPVEMLCWVDGRRVTYRYPSERWFEVREPRSDFRGFVHSSQVVGQIEVSRCP